MPKAEDILWFKQQFHTAIAAGIQGTPFSLDMIAAIACQETGFIWQVLRKRQLSLGQILELCVGDTLDASGGRRAFPQTKADLIAEPNGQQMFAIARQALVDMSQHINGFGAAVSNPNKFCHGFGIFQFDLQFFLTEPDYFLEKRYANFDACLGKCVGELRNALRRVGLQDRAALSDLEMASVAIAYNTGSFKPSKGLKQGHFNGSKFYGEEFFDFLILSKTVQLAGESPDPPSVVTPAEALFEVVVHDSPLRLRSDPSVDKDNPNANVIARLPNGHTVRAATNKEVNGFLEVDTSLSGEQLHGFAAAQFLKRI